MLTENIACSLAIYKISHDGEDVAGSSIGIDLLVTISKTISSENEYYSEFTVEQT